MANVKVFKEASMPTVWVANAVYWVKVGADVKCYVTDSAGTPYEVKATMPGAFYDAAYGYGGLNNNPLNSTTYNYPSEPNNPAGDGVVALQFGPASIGSGIGGVQLAVGYNTNDNFWFRPNYNTGNWAASWYRVASREWVTAQGYVNDLTPAYLNRGTGLTNFNTPGMGMGSYFIAPSVTGNPDGTYGTLFNMLSVGDTFGQYSYLTQLYSPITNDSIYIRKQLGTGGGPTNWRKLAYDEGFSLQARYNGGVGGGHTITHNDSRNVNAVPSNYMVDGVGGTWWDFKDRAVVGLPGTNSYASVMTVVQWNPTQGGGGVHQMAYNDGTGIYYRYGSPNASSWDDWQTVLTLKNRRTRIATGIQNNEDVTLTLGYTEGTDNYEKVRFISKRIDNAARQHLYIAVNTAWSTDSASINDTKIFVDGITGNIGIATTNPTYGFDVVTSARTANGLRATGSLYQFLSNGWSTAIKMDNGNALVFNDKFGIGESGGHLYFSTSDNAAASGSAIYSMLIGNTGEVVVGGQTGNTNMSGDALTVWGAIMAAAGIHVGNANLMLTQGLGAALRVVTPSGWVEIGSQNFAYAHYQTDRPAHYFNRDTYVDGGLILYGTTTQLFPGKLSLNEGSYVTGNNTSWQFLTSANGALPIKAGGVVASDSYADVAPASGIYSKGLAWLNGGLQLGGLTQSSNTTPASFRMLTQNLSTGLVEWAAPNDFAGNNQWRQNDFQEPYLEPDPNVVESYGVSTRGGFATREPITISFNLNYEVSRYDYSIFCINDNVVKMPDPSRYVGRILEFKFVSGDRTTTSTTHLVDFPVVDFDRDLSVVQVSKDTRRMKVQAAQSNYFGGYVWEVLDYNLF